MLLKNNNEPVKMTTLENIIKLKVKTKSLAEEARIIRGLERKYGFDSLAYHRVWDVRNESRATHLATAFLKGKAYKTVESKVHDEQKLLTYILPRVISMVKKYTRFAYRLQIKDVNTIDSQVEKWLKT